MDDTTQKVRLTLTTMEASTGPETSKNRDLEELQDYSEIERKVQRNFKTMNHLILVDHQDDKMASS